MEIFYERHYYAFWKGVITPFEKRYYAFWKSVINTPFEKALLSTTLVSSIYMMHDVDGTLCKQFSEGVGVTDYILYRKYV